jgi:hypothetical protein
MTTRASLFAATVFAVMTAGPVAAQASSSPSPGTDFRGLWTTWTGINRDSMRAEVQAAAPTATPAGAMRAGTPELGARVGEFVRAGNCTEGERLARAAGDFPLLEAVRAHCRSGAIQAVSRR